MKKTIISVGVLLLAIIGIVVLKYSPNFSAFLWNISQGGAWLFPLVIFSALLDSVHPCSFSILLITIAFLFGLQMTRKKILQIGGMYIAGIFAAYFTIGIGILKIIHICLMNWHVFRGNFARSSLGSLYFCRFFF